MRIERLRHQDLNDLVDRAIADIGGGTPRQLVQIYNGGSMVSQPDHFFLSHPVYLNGVAAEGGLGGPSVDVSQTIVVDVIGKAPSVGDQLVAYAVGGRWVAELTSSQEQGGCIQFIGCNNTPLQGVILYIYASQGGALKAGPLTSDANGKICPGLPSGQYWMDPTKTEQEGFPLNLYVWTAQTFGIPQTGVNFWPVQLQPDYGCCIGTPFPLPQTLYLTVCGQTFTLVSGGTQITGWAPEGAIADITTAGVAQNAGPGCNAWDGLTTGQETVPWAVRLVCPSDTHTMQGFAGVCGIGRFDGFVGGFTEYAICPPGCEGVGFGTCCNGGDEPSAGVPFTLKGNIGETINLSGAMPGSVSPECVFPPAVPWPLPCAGEAIIVTN